MNITLDASRMRTRQEAHTYLQEQLHFPDYYGKNLDALFDCLTDLGETTVTFVNIPEEDTYFRKILWVFQDAAGYNPKLKIGE